MADPPPPRAFNLTEADPGRCRGLAKFGARVSHHLKKLVEAGLLACEQRGKWAHFSLKRDAVVSWRRSPIWKERVADDEARASLARAG